MIFLQGEERNLKLRHCLDPTTRHDSRLACSEIPFFSSPGVGCQRIAVACFGWGLDSRISPFS